MANVLITGASGLIGKPLSELLYNNGHTVTHLGRTENLTGKFKCYQWDIHNERLNERAFSDIDTVIHLAGAGIADKRWTSARKKEIIDSRVKSGKMLMKAINAKQGQIKTFVGASAIGYYGAITNEIIHTESMPNYPDFMGSTCKDWEDSYAELNQELTRKVIIRIGVVLSDKGGAMQKLSKTAKMGIASPLGTGKQYMPWIHIDDMVNVLFKAATRNEYNGIYNAVAPQHITNAAFTKELTLAYGKKMFMPSVPAFVLKLVLGEMAAMVLEGSRVSSDKLIAQGFSFKHPDVKEALKNLTNRA